MGGNVDDGFDAFFAKAEATIKRVARKRLYDLGCTDPAAHADDVADAAFVTLWKKWDRLHTPEHALYRITSREASDHASTCRNDATKEAPETAALSTLPTAQEAEDFLSAGLLLEEVLKLLGPKSREIIDLLFQGYSYEEIGQKTGLAASSVRSTYRRAVTKLNEIVGRPHDSDTPGGAHERVH